MAATEYVDVAIDVTEATERSRRGDRHVTLDAGRVVRGVATNDKTARDYLRGPGIRIGAVEHQHAGTRLDQAAVAAECAGKRACIHRQCATASQLYLSTGTAQVGNGLVTGRGQIQRAAIDGYRRTRRKAATRTQSERAAVDRGAAGVEIDSGQGLRSRSLHDQASGTGQRTTEVAGTRAIEGERIRAQVYRATGTVEQAQCLVAGRREIQRATRGEADATGGSHAASGTERQGAGIDLRGTGIRVDSSQRQSTHTQLDEIAAATDHAGVAAIRALVEDQRRVVGDVALQAGSIALQGTRADRRAATVCVGTTQGQDTRSCLGQAARARYHARIGSIRNLVEDQGRVVGDVALEAGGIALQRTRTDRGATAIHIGATQGQGARARLGQVARARHHACIGTVHALVENQRGIVGNIALQARGIALQRTGRDRGAACIRVRTRQGERAGTKLDQGARARHHARVAAIGGLVERQRGVVDNVALQAGGIALQGARADRGAAGIGVGTAQRQGAGAEFGQAARTRNDPGIRAIGDLVERQ